MSDVFGDDFPCCVPKVPYYSDDFVTLFHGDCREVTDWLDADVLVTDPPYGMGYVSRVGETVEGDDGLDARSACLGLWHGKAALVFGTWKVRRPAGTRQVLIWDKSEGNGTGAMVWSPWGLSHEEIYVLGEWPPIEPGGRWREGGSPARVPGVLRVANYNTQAVARPHHPTPKPVPLMERLIEKCPSGTIADPFAGSGSTLVAAKNLGRKAIGVELEERYCEIAARRLAQDVLDFG